MRRVALAVLCVGLGGCERGCLMRWFQDQQGVAEPANSGPAHGVDLTGTDCSDGLLRCANGHVEASQLAHLSSQCGPLKTGRNPEKQGPGCTCPWDVVTSCRTGCAAEGIEVIGAKTDGNAFQLCRPEQPFARPVLGADDASVDVCSDEGIACREGIVRICDSGGAATRNVAFCIYGCAVGVSLDVEGDGPIKNPDGLISILCRRSDAERH